MVRHILPGGSYHATFKADLKIIADFAHNAKGDDGELIPIIFRPWHEFDGNWFWWGKIIVRLKNLKNCIGLQSLISEIL